MKGLLLFLPVCFACLSKPIRENSNKPMQKALIPKSTLNYERSLIHEQKQSDRKCQSMTQKISSTFVDTDHLKSKLDSVFRKENDEHGAYVIASNAPFELKKERNLIWLAATNTGTLEGVLAILKVHHKSDQEMFFERRLVNIFGLLVQQVLLWFNQQLYLTSEENVSEFICMVGAYCHHLNSCAKGFAQLEAMGAESNGYSPVSRFCSVLARYAQGLLITFDPQLQCLNSIRDFSHIKINKFEDIYMQLLDTKLDAAKLEKILGVEMFVGARRVNNEVMGEFEERYQKTKRDIEEQFNDQDPEDLLIDGPPDEVPLPVQNNSKTEGTVENNSDIAELVKMDQVRVEHEVLSQKIPTLDQVREEQQVVSQKIPTSGKCREEIMTQYKANRQSRLEARFEKERSKHSTRVSKLRFDEHDDDDVRFFYTFKNPAANSTFSLNQAQQMCKTNFMSAKRYEHSMFPGISASGSTINFLCSLLVSGTPTYEGFLAAHKDLGGIFVEKKNGNKLFFFTEPISYHKTLHAPHESSRFDHRLYRMFYRNCGLHPYFFKLIE